ncbi:ABC transporter substrate-binding protein [Halopelagius longus]|uniref:Fe3+-hydroxamate ABC transporter substrate-binding protein n=1 Tax=Halopelagius longus TaxID=1236180 RepID=A0A1H0XR72_9EURY|nr:ABC transporter substrate-binding protein [Halopelagius longus]RDI72031.1 Fe3+-hydroxamate ABC transporter substrate-binding protein [Halopelagius longus]SDQ05343.1 ferrichrome-binding protein [Halopelagius longus]
MANDGAPRRTRRNVLKASGVLAASGLLAGCTGGSGSESTETEASATESATATETETGTESETTESGSSYSVSIEPMGEVEFAQPPETWVANNGSWADMGVALGVEPPKGVWMTSRYHTQYYDEIPDVSVDKSDMVSLYSDGVSKEVFYELDGDVHVMDPNFLLNRYKGWKQADVDEIEEKIAPFFGNSIFSRGYAWHEDYKYYTLYEAFEKLAQVFQRTDRYEAFASLHDEFQSGLSDVVPSSESERPQVAILWASGDEPESFLPYVISEGTSFKQWRDLNVRDALAETDVKDFHSSRGEIDYETLLEVDPDVLLFRGQEAKTAEEFQNTVVSFMENHDTASALTAVQNGDVYRGGPLYQGPITNLVLTERAAKQLYDVEGELFDRERVASIVNGDI